MLLLFFGFASGSADVEGDVSVRDFTIYNAGMRDFTIYSGALRDFTIYGASLRDVETT